MLQDSHNRDLYTTPLFERVCHSLGTLPLVSAIERLEGHPTSSVSQGECCFFVNISPTKL